MTNNLDSLINPIKRTEKNPYGVQKKPLGYYEIDYLKPNRMSSYGHQIKLAIETNGISFLNIGSGNSILKFILSKHDKYIIDLDLDFFTNPTVTARLPELPFPNSVFDVVMCYQVLEHIPFNLFSLFIKECVRISSSAIIISLPDISISKEEMVKNQIFKVIKHPREWKAYTPRTIDPEHFWEIGHGNVQIQNVIAALTQERLSIQKHYRNDLNPYHHFFVLQVNK